MSHDELAALQNEMAHKPGDELREHRARRPSLLGWQRLKLGYRPRKPMRSLHVFAAQVAIKLRLVVARDHQRRARIHHALGQQQAVDRARPTVHQVAQEDRPTRLVARHALGVVHVAKAIKEHAELVVATMHIADDVEGPALLPRIRIDLGALKLRRRNARLAVEHIDIAKAFFAERETSQPSLHGIHAPAQAATKRPVLRDHPAAAALTTLALGIVPKANFDAHIEHDGHRDDVIATRQREHRGAIYILHIRRIDHRQQPRSEPLLQDEMKRRERIGGGAHVVLVVAHHAAKGIGGEHLGGAKQTLGQRAFARARGADQQHKRERGDAQSLLVSLSGKRCVHKRLHNVTSVA